MFLNTLKCVNQLCIMFSTLFLEFGYLAETLSVVFDILLLSVLKYGKTVSNVGIVVSLNYLFSQLLKSYA